MYLSLKKYEEFRCKSLLMPFEIFFCNDDFYQACIFKFSDFT